MKTENEKYNEVYENLVTKFPQRKDLIDEFLNKEEADDETQNEMTNVIFHK